jgi:hypothetical protein
MNTPQPFTRKGFHATLVRQNDASNIALTLTTNDQ